MKIVKTVDEVRVIVKEWKKEGLTVGLVPTMGFLHEGHKSLITRAVSENDRVVVSDFVNPTQFGVGEDLESYPRDLERDTMLCEEAYYMWLKSDGRRDRRACRRISAFVACRIYSQLFYGDSNGADAGSAGKQQYLAFTDLQI